MQCRVGNNGPQLFLQHEVWQPQLDSQPQLGAAAQQLGAASQVGAAAQQLGAAAQQLGAAAQHVGAAGAQQLGSAFAQQDGSAAAQQLGAVSQQLLPQLLQPQPVPSIRSRRVAPKLWLQRPTLTASAPKSMFHFIEQRLLCRELGL
jgi:RND superfamily putative drug exporter